MSSNSNTRGRPRIEPKTDKGTLGAADSLCLHWPEYLMEAGEAGLYLFSACTVATLLWHAYVQTVDEDMRERTRSSGSFLRTLEDPERAAKVRSGGLIHHWIGAAFLPGTSIDRVVEVMRDYDRYKDFYNPFVVDSKVVGRDGLKDRFTMQIMNKAFSSRNALDADYLTDTVVLDGRRAYSISRTTRVQEIEEYGRPEEHKVAEGKGGGYIWKLHSIVRMEQRQRDGGVYIELEAVAWSRGIPAAFRMVAEPIRPQGISQFSSHVASADRASCARPLHSFDEACRYLDRCRADRHADVVLFKQKLCKYRSSLKDRLA